MHYRSLGDSVTDTSRGLAIADFLNFKKKKEMVMRTASDELFSREIYPARHTLTPKMPSEAHPVEAGKSVSL